MNKDIYGNNNPPYTLYQAPDGKWGLVDKDGVKLPAKFERHDDRFSAVPWEVVTFNEQEGWDLLAWYDPCEVWFNFTWDDAAYNSEKWGKLLWKKNDKEVEKYLPLYFECVPEKDRWLIDAISIFISKEKEIDYFKPESDECMSNLLKQLLAQYPELDRLGKLNDLLAPVLDNPDIPEDAKVVLWSGKVSLDYELRYYYSSRQTYNPQREE